MMRRLFLTIFCILTGFALAMPAGAAPDDFEVWNDPGGAFSDAQTSTLQRDAQLLQSTNVPTMVWVRTVDTAEEADVESAQSYADRLRSDHDVESAAGADDGLVLFVTLVRGNTPASVAVYSVGENALTESGISDVGLQSTIDNAVKPLLAANHPFEALVYFMRETRYDGLYLPPPNAPLSDAQQTVRDLMTPVSALITITAAAVATWLTSRFMRTGAPTQRQVWTVVAIVLALLGLLAAVSVWSQSRVGTLAVGLGVAILAISVWLWTHAPIDRFQPRYSIWHDWREWAPDVGLALLFFLVSFGVNMSHVRETDFHPDETRWMHRATYARDYLDPFGPTWNEYATTIGQPPLGSIMMGIGLAVQGKDLDATASWDFAYARDWNAVTGAMPEDEDRFAARRTNAVIGALATASIYVLGRLLINRVGGAFGALYLTWQPLHIVLSTQALSDETLALILGLIFITGWSFARKPTWSRAIILGILLGLGGSVKLTPLLLSVPLAGFGILRWLIQRDRPARDYALKLFAQPAIAFAAFVASYPFLWPNPISRTYKLFEFRVVEMEGQGATWTNAMVDGPFDALRRFGYKLTYQHSTTKNAIQAIYDWLGIDRTAVGIDLLFGAAGLVILIWWVARRGLWTPHAMVALLMGGQAAAIVVGMKTDFYRYHLPIIVIIAACIAVAMGVAWQQVANAYRASRRPSPPPATETQGIAP